MQIECIILANGTDLGFANKVKLESDRLIRHTAATILTKKKLETLEHRAGLFGLGMKSGPSMDNSGIQRVSRKKSIQAVRFDWTESPNIRRIFKKQTQRKRQFYTCFSAHKKLSRLFIWITLRRDEFIWINIELIFIECAETKLDCADWWPFTELEIGNYETASSKRLARLLREFIHSIRELITKFKV